MYFKKIIWIVFVFLLFCSQEQNQLNETILAKVGSKTISVNEFVRRAEYTIRPPWCRSDDYIARKVVLNSLIAEKLLALDADEPGEIVNNEEINLYLQGRKEQAMRQIHFDELGNKKVNISELAIKTPLKMAERKYNISIIPINDDNLAKRIYEDLKTAKTNFSDLESEFSLASKQEIKEQEISFETPIDDILFKSLYMNETNDEQVIGPLKIEKNKHILVKINGWIRRPVISEKDINQKYVDVRDKIKEVTAKDIYVDWISEKMKSKKLNFNTETFESLVNIVGPDYFKSEKDKEKAFNKRFWSKDDSEMLLDDLAAQLEAILDDPLLEIDGEEWTVRRFEKEIKKHPLVFRNRKMAKSDFTNEFRLAIADLIRDKYITEDAYEREYNNDPRVVRNTEMWKDNIFALYQRRKILNPISGDSTKPAIIVNKHLNPVVEDLRRKYQDQILINTDAFEKIHLTSVDMFVIQKNMPFPVMVPQFPILTTHNKLNYGQKM